MTRWHHARCDDVLGNVDGRDPAAQWDIEGRARLFTAIATAVAAAVGPTALTRSP
ncbi:putative mannosyl-3-phosphoglycerate phosphatase (HAD superfamily) [Microbacterium proteolyticum]|uniref:Putative mannosyl-3-phosphoglycerate phosphatase (HAD superfamily) n=1 Tax=Microbacterium proteolyticum TaxID=1572644 RepID=A0A7W5GF53_9MICO|nr:hypothetical protein [Microbacterium proteolyticum]MBB3156837.1 putative mannosyl-3-phosphoglycerate phosphatase (HAD superfamily) [Microbacterium proteolyticum]